MELLLYAQIPTGRVAALRGAISGHNTLEKVVRWGFSQAPLLDVAEVVHQDEFTRDVLLPLHDGLVLVYDTT